MRATRLNHVSIRAEDLEESAAYYEGVFGLQLLAMPRFGAPLNPNPPTNPKGET